MSQQIAGSIAALAPSIGRNETGWYIAPLARFESQEEAYRAAAELQQVLAGEDEANLTLAFMNQMCRQVDFGRDIFLGHQIHSIPQRRD